MTYSVLSVEDNPSDVKLLKLVMRRENIDCNFFDVSSIADALGFVAKQPPDIIFLDLNVRDAFGVDSFHRLQKAVSKEIPIIVLTGGFTGPIEMELMQAGAAAVLDKNRLTMINPEIANKVILAISAKLRQANQDKEREMYRELARDRRADDIKRLKGEDEKPD